MHILRALGIAGARLRLSLAFISLAAVSALAQDAHLPVIPIPQQPWAQPVPEYVGAPATANPIPALAVPKDPYLAPNGRSGIHLDGYNSDTYPTPGPLGHSPDVTSTFLFAECGTVTFDKQGLINMVCFSQSGPILRLHDPSTLETLATFPLPPGNGQSGFSAGGYFFLDENDRTVIPTRTRDIWIIKHVQTTAGTQFALDHTCSADLPAMIPEDQSILSTLPDSRGLLWFTTSGGADPLSEPAMVGTARPDPNVSDGCTVKLYTLPSGESISKSFAVDPDPSRSGVFIVSDYKMYRFDNGWGGAPVLTWQEEYDRGSHIKPGQIQRGSGTTPTLMGTDYVTITDNADPQMHVLVYRRAASTNKPRLVCAEPVFKPHRSATENSLIATDRSITVENNYGNRNLLSTFFGATTEPGLARVDLNEDGGSCHTVWTTYNESVPNIVSQVSLATGLEYAYTKDRGPDHTDAWYFTAIDFRTGETVYKRLAGTGILYNSNYSGLYLGPDGKTAYLGVLGGLVRIHENR